MFIEFRKEFAGTDPAINLRSLLDEAGTPISYSLISIKLRTFGFDGVGSFQLTLFREGSPASSGSPIQNTSSQSDMFVVRPGNDPTWVDSLMIGPSITGGGTRTLVMIIE